MSEICLRVQDLCAVVRAYREKIHAPDNDRVSAIQSLRAKTESTNFSATAIAGGAAAPVSSNLHSDPRREEVIFMNSYAPSAIAPSG